MISLLKSYLKEYDFENEDDLDNEIKILETSINNSENKVPASEEEQEQKVTRH